MSDSKKCIETAADLRAFAASTTEQEDYEKAIQVVRECRKAIADKPQLDSLQLQERVSDGVKLLLERHGFTVEYTEYDASSWRDEESCMVTHTVVSWSASTSKRGTEDV